MGETTQANVSRIRHKLDAGAQYRRNTELAFLAIVVAILAFGAGYFAGCFWPYEGKPPAWAEKVGAARAARLPEAHKSK